MTEIGREFRLPSDKDVHGRAEGNLGGPRQTKAVVAVIIVDVGEKREQGGKSRSRERR